MEERFNTICKLYTLEELAQYCIELEDTLENARKRMSELNKELEKERKLTMLVSRIDIQTEKLDLEKLKKAMKNCKICTIDNNENERLKYLEDQHQSDYIKINQLQTTIDVLVDKLARLRE